MLAGGDFRKMESISRWGTFFFYWSWVLLSFVILMNIVISILTESHIEATKLIERIEEDKSKAKRALNDEDEVSGDDDNETDVQAVEEDGEHGDSLPRELDDRMAALERQMDVMVRMLEDQQQFLRSLAP